ncbi:metal ABC transporter substrate-binding protein [Lagierella sp.]|uniref:metal ABC transporter substrate-binding protein n=1 Tax=Lagierella sp. TaxID=2849657 RepID=UPI00260E000D|nr:metal ABC transporter substrate-binding protein [Lagierella sp.]
MKKVLSIILILIYLLTFTGCEKQTKAKEKPIVYTSFYPVYSLAKDVFKDTVDLRIFMPISQDPHLWEPSPKKMRELEEADLLIINGANLERWTDKIPELFPNLEILNLASGINLITYKGAAALGDFQYLGEGKLTDEVYRMEFGHTHEKHLRIAFVLVEEKLDENKTIDIGRKIMEQEGQEVPQRELIEVESSKVYKLEMGHEQGEIFFKVPKSGKWLIYTDRISSEALSYKFMDSKEEPLNLRTLRDVSTTSEDKVTYDPHTWMSVRNAKRFVKDMEYVGSRKFPEFEKEYRDNSSKVLQELTALDYKYRDLFSKVDRKEFIVSHYAFAYLAKDFKLIQYPLQNLTSMEAPSIKKIRKVIEDSKDKGINTIFYEYGMPKNGADIIAEEIGADIKGLISMEYVNRDMGKVGSDYIDYLKYNLETLYRSMR